LKASANETIPEDPLALLLNCPSEMPAKVTLLEDFNECNCKNASYNHTTADEDQEAHLSDAFIFLVLRRESDRSHNFVLWEPFTSGKECCLLEENLKVRRWRQLPVTSVDDELKYVNCLPNELQTKAEEDVQQEHKTSTC